MGSRLEKNSTNVRKRIESHTFDNEDGEEYEASTFGGFTQYMRRKKIKLQNLDAQIRSQSGDKPQIFRGVVAQVNGYTQPSLNDLHILIVSHGGGFLQYLDGKTAVTHIIASQLTPKKKAEFAKYRIVKPAWVVDSVKAEKLLPWENYRVVDEGVTQKVLGFDGGQIVSQTNRPLQSYRGQSDTSWYASHVKDAAQEIDGIVRQKPSDSEPEERILTPEDDTLFAEDDREEFGTTIIDDGNSHVYEEHDTGYDQHHVVHDAEAEGEVALPNLASSTNIVGGNADLGLDSVNEASAISTGSENVNNRQLTAEEHNAILLQDPHVAKSSTANPDFLNQYYRESRLHHLSAWKAQLKAQLQARTLEKSSSQKTQRKRPAGARRYVMHVDFDSFFVAVSLLKCPHLVDKAVVVAHGSGPGSEIASCNYPARKYGIKNGMWMKSALELCANIKVLPYDYAAYEEASKHFYDEILAIDGIVQSISIDEALIDISLQCSQAGESDGQVASKGALEREQVKANQIAESLRASVKLRTGCDVSVGIGGNILLAKVALRKAKPAGQHLIKPEDVLNFVGELNITDLPGVAHSIEKKLGEIGVKQVKDIRSLNKERLVNVLGPKTGEKLWEYSRGIDKVEVGDQVIRKSVSAEINWGIRFVTQQQAEEFVQCLCDELQKRLLENGVKGRQLTMKIMRKAADAGLDPPKNLGHGKCDTFNKSIVLGLATNDKALLGREAISILRGYGFSPGELRGLGVQMQKLEPIKAVVSSNPPLIEGSQRRLQFKKPDVSMIKAPPTPRKAPAPQPARVPKHIEMSETIEEVPSPERPPQSPMVLGAVDNTNHHVDERPLNIIGTQFMLPSQVDPTVLAELPEDIRSKFAPKAKSMVESMKRSASPATDVKSRSASPYISDYEHILPNQSQVDPETLAALPDDVKDELLAHYGASSKNTALGGGQLLLPQSPRKTRILPPSKKLSTTPTKKHKISTLFGRGRPKTNSASTSTLTQSNFVSLPQVDAAYVGKEVHVDQDISKSFLEELPEDIRLEVLAEQKRNRMKINSGLNVSSTRKKAKVDPSKTDLPKGQQKIYLPAHPEKPTFTSRKLSSLPELRDAMSAWVQEFSSGGGDGPFAEDAAALGQYLTKVVINEEDMAKAVSVVDWLIYLVDDWPFDRDDVRFAWLAIIDSLKKAVQEAVSRRGLPPIEFGVD